MFRCYYGLNTILISRMSSKSLKIQLNRILIRPVVMFGGETWTMHKIQENDLLQYSKYDNNLKENIRPVLRAEIRKRRGAQRIRPVPKHSERNKKKKMKNSVQLNCPTVKILLGPHPAGGAGLGDLLSCANILPVQYLKYKYHEKNRSLYLPGSAN